MSTYTSPANATEVGGVAREASPLAKRFQKLMAGGPRGAYNLWILSDGTVTESEPQATYNSDGTVASLPYSTVVRFLQGGASHTLTAAEVTILTTAGYGAYIT